MNSVRFTKIAFNVLDSMDQDHFTPVFSFSYIILCSNYILHLLYELFAMFGGNIFLNAEKFLLLVGFCLI